MASPTVVPSVDVTALPAATKRELDNLLPTITRMAQWGQVLDLPYAAANFYAETGTWTVPLVAHLSYRYTIVNTVMTIWVTLGGTTTSAGMGTSLFIRLPAGYGIQPIPGSTALSQDNSTFGTAFWTDSATTAGPAIVKRSSGLVPHSLALIRDTTGTAWPTGTISLSVHATVPVYLL